MMCGHQYAVGVVAAAAVIQTGCGGNPYGAVPVSGRVTVGGQKPAAECEIFFVPAPHGDTDEKAFRPRPTVALSDLDGAFVVSSFKEGDGLLPGTYDVRVECWKTRPQESEDGKPAVKGVSIVPSGYAAPGLTVAAGSSPVRYDIDLPTVAAASGKEGAR